jgi:hypothetical protein
LCSAVRAHGSKTNWTPARWSKPELFIGIKSEGGPKSP